MSKQIVVYRENERGEIAKFIDGVEVVDGEVVNENNSGNAFFNFFASFFRGNHRPHNDNWREYNPASGNREYTVEANGNAASPTQCNYEAPQDYQGSVPVWDGYSGE